MTRKIVSEEITHHQRRYDPGTFNISFKAFGIVIYWTDTLTL